MNVYEAAINLDIWPVVKARAEIWSVTRPSESVFLDFQELIKRRYKELVMVHHPDRGGNADRYIKITESYEHIKASSINDIVDSLAQERRTTAKFYRPNSPECVDCEKWSAMMGLCMITTCTGFESRECSVITLPSHNKVGRRFTGTFDGASRITG